MGEGWHAAKDPGLKLNQKSLCSKDAAIVKGAHTLPGDLPGAQNHYNAVVLLSVNSVCNSDAKYNQSKSSVRYAWTILVSISSLSNREVVPVQDVPSSEPASLWVEPSRAAPLSSSFPPSVVLAVSSPPAQLPHGH